MCKNAQATALDLLAAVEPTLISLGNATGIENSPAFQQALTAYNNTVAAIKNWTPGTASQEAIEVINDLETEVQALPIPEGDIVLLNIVLAGISTVIGVIGANSPAPPAPSGTVATAAPEVTQALHAHAVIEATTSKVQKLVPGFKRSIWHSASNQYKKAWNDTVQKGGFSSSLRTS